ncbi:polyphosphate--glucose phosphotransferase [Marinifilum caeruleilacunae]|uniref:ROK family protein n=1 Tax=Marinifilum caeruleilacunae TaxID=2499076 RepID=A0ABX1WZ45_9BACT|nr:ROK family protein [Marinifilum caeruleilacunae]NOU61372.1 ROK family protein [Marinifilum caeruleilacunae]
MKILGIDIGGSGIKGAPVNVVTGEQLEERFRIPTPQPSTPEAVADVIKEIVDHFNWTGPVGCGFPTIISHGKAMAHGNMDPSWIGVQVDELFSKKTGLEVTVVNDADAAGLAEMRYGVGKDKSGLVVMVTIGTGLGSGVFYNGHLLPNFELGQLKYKNGKIIEKYAADSVRKKEELSFPEWGKRFNEFLHHVNLICAPDYFIIGGGASKKLHKFEDEIDVEVPVLVAEFQNGAGIIGAAVSANGLK